MSAFRSFPRSWPVTGLMAGRCDACRPEHLGFPVVFGGVHGQPSHGDDRKIPKAMTPTQLIGTSGSAVPPPVATLHQGNPDRNHMFWNIGSTERQSFPRSWPVTGLMAGRCDACRPEHLGFPVVFGGVHVARSLVFCVVFYRSLLCSGTSDQPRGMHSTRRGHRNTATHKWKANNAKTEALLFAWCIVFHLFISWRYQSKGVMRSRKSWRYQSKGVIRSRKSWRYQSKGVIRSRKSWRYQTKGVIRSHYSFALVSPWFAASDYSFGLVSPWFAASDYSFALVSPW
jgi:hypothetical protein